MEQRKTAAKAVKVAKATHQDHRRGKKTAKKRPRTAVATLSNNKAGRAACDSSFYRVSPAGIPSPMPRRTIYIQQTQCEVTRPTPDRVGGVRDERQAPLRFALDRPGHSLRPSTRRQASAASS